MSRVHRRPWPPRPFSRGVVFAQTGPEAVAFDARAIAEVGVPQAVLMENAGRAAAEVVSRLFPEGRVVVFVGTGNNGGDALVLLRTLRAWGRDVRGVQVGERTGGASLLHGWDPPLLDEADLDELGGSGLLGTASVIVDGILGTGVRGAPRPRQAAAIRRIVASGCPVVALDLPSGIDGSSGEVPGDAVQATVTVAFGAPKLGSLLHPARARVGRLIVVEIGFPPIPHGGASALVVTPGWARSRLPRRGTDTHKNEVGRLLVLAGGIGMAGAAVLATRGAFRSGAGLVRVGSVPENREVLQGSVPEAIWVDATDRSRVEEALGQVDAVAVGPGLGTAAWGRDLLSWVADGPGIPTLLDADALNLAAAGTVDLPALARGRPLLLTPHPGEMGRLLAASGGGTGGVGAASVVREASARFGCAVLLKGAPSLVAAPEWPLLVDTQGSSDLAVAGMGDALSGVSAGLMAQGLGAPEAGAVGLYLSGRAAALAALGVALTPSDVLEWIPEALREALQGEGGDDEDALDLPFVTFDADPAR